GDEERELPRRFPLRRRGRPKRPVPPLVDRAQRRHREVARGDGEDGGPGEPRPYRCGERAAERVEERDEEEGAEDEDLVGQRVEELPEAGADAVLPREPAVPVVRDRGGDEEDGAEELPRERPRREPPQAQRRRHDAGEGEGVGDVLHRGAGAGGKYTRPARSSTRPARSSVRAGRLR